MKSPYVCAVCGEPIEVGRHSSGWRHAATVRADHAVRKIAREEYERTVPRISDVFSDDDPPTWLPDISNQQEFHTMNMPPYVCSRPLNGQPYRTPGATCTESGGEE